MFHLSCMNTYVLYSLPKGLNLLYYIHEKRTASIILKYLSCNIIIIINIYIALFFEVTQSPNIYDHTSVTRNECFLGTDSKHPIVKK